jgi:uncharacterized protein
MADKSRNLAEKIGTLLGYFPIVAIFGARQVGKTSLAKQLRPEWRYINLENPLDFDRIAQDPLFFFTENPNDLIIDEIQEYPELFRVLSGIVDSNRQKKGRIILTGSSSPRLLKSMSESLAGRIGVVELGTFKANEYYGAPLSSFYQIFDDKLDKDRFTEMECQLSSQEMKKVWLRGGYPEPMMSDQDDFYRQWMDNYYATYLNRDVKKLFPKLATVKYRRLLSMLARLSGSIVKKSDLSRALEISEPTVNDYIEIADGTFVWKKLTSFEHNIEKSTVKMPSGHYRDSGLCHYLLKLESIEDVENDPIIGKSFECFVIEEIIKGVEATSTSNWDAHYFRTKNGVDIDLILEGPFGLLPIEVKYGLATPAPHLRSLKSFIGKHDLPFGILINNSEKIEWLTEKIVQIPVGCL